MNRSRRIKREERERLRSLVEHVLPELGKTNATRLKSFLALKPKEDGSHALSEVFRRLYPEAPKAKALDSFKKFCAAVNEAAKAAQSSLRIVRDGSRARDLSARRCWFEANPDENAELDEFGMASSQPHTHGASEKSRAIPSGSVYRIFVSYAHEDEKPVFDLLDQLGTILTALLRGKPYEIDIWSDRNIEPGQQWRPAIQNELKQGHLGLLFLSPSFLASEFIQKEEVPHFIGGVDEATEAKACIPLMVEEFPLETYHSALGGIADHQIYRYQHKNGKRYAWNRCRGNLKNDFLNDFAARLLKRMDEIHARAPAAAAFPDPPSPARSVFPDKLREMEEFERLVSRHDTPLAGREKSRGRTGNLKTLDALAPSAATEGAREVVAVDYLLDWAQRAPDWNNEFIAVLGEFGIGKTTTLRQFAQELLARRRENPRSSLPRPLVFDLRAYQRRRRQNDSITLDAVLEACLSSVKHPEGKAWRLTAEDLKTVVREQGAIAIFDGLDEVMNALTQPERQEFIRELWSILPPPPDFSSRRPEGRGRVIMSCRSHFFRDVVQQNGLYTGQAREGIEAAQRSSLVILPFTREQILSYLESCIGKEEGPRAYERLEKIHDLLDLARRPVLLNMIREIIPDLERAMLGGGTVRAVDLYRRFLKQHLDRDEGKHVFTTGHKLRLMEALAADLWISGRRQWPWDRLEEWLDHFLRDHPEIAQRYSSVKPEVLYQDFRNATAIVRPAEEREHFRFAHTSLQEYFLAGWLHRSLTRREEREKWGRMRLPSDETLDFLGQLFAKENEATGLETLARLMEKPKGQSALIGFRYWLLAGEKGHPAPRPRRLLLRGRNLYRWKIQGRDREAPLTLLRPDFTNANLSETEWRNVTLVEADFSRTRLLRSRWRNCRFERPRLNGARTDGARFRSCQWTQPRFAPEDRWEGAWIIDGHGFPSADSPPHALVLPLPESEWSSAELAVQSAGRETRASMMAVDEERNRYVTSGLDGRVRVWDAHSWECVATLEGHEGRVLCVAVDGERGRYVTGGNDRQMRVWDAHSLKCVATLEGHAGGVWSVAVDGKRGRYLTGGADGRLRIWDAHSLKCVATLEGHAGGVWSVAVDGERGRYITGGTDGRLRVWDTHSLKCVATLEGHADGVWSVAVDGERNRYITSGLDGRVRVWDAHSRECAATLEGHASEVLSVAVDGERGRYLTGGADGHLRIWDAHSRECVATLEGHAGGVWNVAVDGERGRCLTGGADGRLRVWDAHSLKCMAMPEEPAIWVLSVAVDGKRGRYLTGGDGGRFQVWDAHSLKCVATLEGHAGEVRSVAVDGERGRYLTGGADGRLRVWDAHSLKCVATLEGHAGRIWSVAVDGERGRYVTGDADGQVRIWDAHSLKCVATLYSLPDGQWASVPAGQRHPRVLSPRASEHLMWVVRDPRTRQLRALPYEALPPS